MIRADDADARSADAAAAPDKRRGARGAHHG